MSRTVSPSPARPAAPAPSALALAMAQQLRAWSQRLGETAELQALLHEHALALMQARDHGHSCLPLPAEAARALRGSSVVGSPQAPGPRPLLLDETGRLYLQREFEHERALALQVAQRVAQPPRVLGETIQAALQAAFGGAGAAPDTPDAQRLAATAALTQRLALMAGGPGTGKTTTVARLLGVLLQEQPQARVALAAPTGKAAARLTQALAEHDAALAARLPATTVHRLLGAGRDGFAHGPQHPLALDWLVVDEASMLDLALARRLFEALPLAAHLLLVGDAGQLAAVEVGAVFAELTSAGLPGSVALQRSHRFGSESGLARFAQAVREGRREDAQALLAAPPDDTLQLQADTGAAALRAADTAGAALAQAACQLYAQHFAALREPGAEPGALLAGLARQRVLCATREGPRGVATLNRLLLQQLRQQPGTLSHSASPWCAGTPLLVLKNEPALQLFNGDIGLVWPDAQGTLVAWFAQPEGPPRALALHRLPPHEAAFALTVHKAQGSEFERVLVVLPARGSPLLLREWLTTAVTRARRQVRLMGEPQAVAEAVQRPGPRHSGLLARLREATAEGAAP